MVDRAGDAGTFRPGAEVTLIGGADIGWFAYGLAGDLWPHLHEQSVCALLAVDGAESCSGPSTGEELSDAGLFAGTTGDWTMFLRKSM